ncbi:hypothetical protein PDIG_44000 [Penicillium digitatum PHI26]|uniref:Methyl methanesulfonate-sensitivity protein 22 n=3 Tax=Penicillium digitatum TaxID=36651 RepID=K9GGW7_PEND2|nr:hypothetical protein PDIP_35230 [Penicillium digitatum Pd1]EKV12476.1 hypothetical protein PDIG_44000 [Penicillium digitatum PHI26]EKV16540.1 hypothetical protein PDIP_35230 [Penicillium digitatum Pd1]
MESWRQRGYVPDSDEEDGFDSLDSKKGNVGNSPTVENLEYIDTPSSSPKEGTSSVAKEQQEHVRAENGSITLSDTEEMAYRNTNRPSPHFTITAHDETTPKQRRGRKTYGPRSSATKATNRRSSETCNTSASAKNSNSIYDFPTSSQEHERSLSKRSSCESTPKPLKTTQPSQSHVIAEPHTSKATTKDETSSTRSSSPDELTLISQPPQKKKPVVQHVQPKEPPQLPPQSSLQEEASDDDSPLSSVPSSFGSPPANDSTELHLDGMMEVEPERPAGGDADLRQAVLVELDAIPDDVLPRLDIPEEVLRELPHAAQRTFRKRNAIQLQPYYLEQVKFAQQLQARGVKPFGRPAQQRQQVTDESQGQDSYDPDALPSSPPLEEYLPPIRYERNRGPQYAAQGQGRKESEHSRSLQAHVAKRQKTSHSGTPKARRNLHKPSKPRGIRDRITDTEKQVGNSIYELSSSPPHAGRLSSTSRTPRASEGGFRFPRGWSPPGEFSKTGAQGTKEASRVQSTGVCRDVDTEVQSISSNSQSDPEETGSDAEEREIRRFQRMIRGALPASHARLDQRKIADRQKVSQLDRHVSSQRPDGKGVARKLIRKSDRSREPAMQQSRGLFDLGDSDSDDEEKRNDATGNVSMTSDSSQSLTGTLNLQESFALEGGDISEDNRIDYMIGPVPRNSKGSRHKPNSLKRPKSKIGSFNGERQRKRPRQTRMTDASYGTRRTKKHSTILRPRIGILDAPDVATKPRTEQSRLLRVAARRPRSRKDGGRQSPTHKFVKLASREDTIDANESLRDWQRGVIRQAKIYPPRSRAPQHRHWSTNLSMLSARAKSNSNIGRIPNNIHDAEVDADFSNTNTVELEHAQMAPKSSAISVPPNQAPMAESFSRQKTDQHARTWVIPRNVAITSLKRNTIRPAATSLAGPGRSQKMVPAMFNQSLSLLNRHYKNQRTSQPYKPSLTLDRYVSDGGSWSTGGNTSPMNASVTAAASAEVRTHVPTPKAPVSRRRLKKHPPNRLNLDADEFRQNPDPATILSDDSESPTVTGAVPARPSSFGVGGLFNWQRFYPVDFGIPSLRDNTFFHESTFIGSGEFSRSLRIAERDFDGDAALFSIQLRDETFQWSRWNDRVSSEMGHVFDMITDNVERSAVTSPETGITAALGVASRLYRLLIKFTTGNLVFIDPVDRTGFVTRAMGLVSQVKDPLAAFLTSDEYNKSGLVKIACFNMIFSNQIYQVASHRLVSPALAAEALDLVKTSAKDVVGLITSKVGSSEFELFFKENNEPGRRDSGIRDEFPSAEAYVVTKHLLRSSDIHKGYFEDLQLETFNNRIIRNEMDVGNLEAGWRGLFTVLPLNEIDMLGIARPGYQLTAANDNWKLAKRLLAPALDQFESNSKAQPFSYNTYCRTLFLRCHRLINSWGWRECKPILDTLFDFFAKNTLHNLKLEEARGSPSFLDELDSNPSLDARVGEPCFHTFLKIVASGLRFLAKRYDTKKIRNFAWRLLPNHGRVYPKEQPLQHEDLDALRNHHDLLSTLYWAVPDGCRPRLETIRNLVHPATSHREACSINLRSWSRLVRFKLSTDEEVSGLDPFGDWYGYFVTELQQQHSYARKEIEAQNTGDNRVSQQLVERTISQNQRQIETLLSNALSGMRIAVQLAPKLEHAHRLVLRTPFESILTLFNPKLPRVNVVVSEALQVLVAYIQKDAPAATTSDTPVVVNTDDDSQEFGDWDAIQAVWDQQSSLSEGIEYVQQAFHPIVSRLVSNCFGEDHCPEDAILLNVVECWTSIAQVLIRHGLRNWDNYLSEFGDDSWTRLRQTVQTRKFAPLFLAACIEKNAQIVSDCRIQVMSMWISSLVERSSMLKFQHRLTEALLNGSPTDPLLANLPFYKDKKIGRYLITLEEIGSRRQSLLSSLSSNMREQLLSMELSGDRNFPVTKQDYSEILRRVMTSMKDNYQELGNGTAQAAQGEYVMFVQLVIGFLQQHTSDIQPIDPFFTDPASFPLPSTDPRYIVAKLKRYESKLSSSKEIQTLTGFVQSISERAAIDGQQSYLVDQLHTSMKNTYEAGDHEKPTLRAVLLQSVFPVYLEATLSNRAAWILSRPIIQTITLEFKNLLCYTDTLDTACVSSVIDILDVVCRASCQAVTVVALRRHSLQSPVTILMLAAILDMISSALPVVDYIDRTAGAGQGILTHIKWIRDFTKAVSTSLQSIDPDADLSSSSAHITFPAVPPPSDSRKTKLLSTANNLASNDLQIYLRKWSYHRGKYYFTRPGHDSQEIPIEPEMAGLVASPSEAQKVFEAAARGFVDRAKFLELLT